MSGSSWIFEVHRFFSFSPDDDVIWFVGRVVVESSWLDRTEQKDVANEPGPESACSATMSNEETQILTMTMTGEEIPKTLRGSETMRRPSRMVAFRNFERWYGDGEIMIWVLKVLQGPWSLNSFDLGHTRPWQVDPWFLTQTLPKLRTNKIMNKQAFLNREKSETAVRAKDRHGQAEVERPRETQRWIEEPRWEGGAIQRNRGRSKKGWGKKISRDREGASSRYKERARLNSSPSVPQKLVSDIVLIFAGKLARNMEGNLQDLCRPVT